MLLGEKDLRLLERAADDEDERHDHAADEERNSPAPGIHLRRSKISVERVAERGGDDDRHLLAARLPAHVEAFISGRRHLREVNRDAAELGPGGKSLQQSADEDEQRRRESDGRIARYERDQYRTERHDGERGNKTLAAADAVDIAAEHDGAEGSHQKTGAEGHEGQHQRSEFAVERKEGLRDVCGVKSEQKEVEHLQEVSTGDAQNRGDPRSRSGFGCHKLLPWRSLSSTGCLLFPRMMQN